jgi:ribosomal protein S18 acetylase RimI-like enzyme
MVQFRKIGEGDWRSIQQIANETWPNTYGAHLSLRQISCLLETTYSERSLRAQMLDEHHQFILAENDNLPVGFASYENNYEGRPRLMIHKLYLLPASQGLGIGTQFIKLLIATATATQFEGLLLKVFCQNSKAILFYEKQGFKKIGTAQKEVGNNCTVVDLIMAKEL